MGWGWARVDSIRLEIAVCNSDIAPTWNLPWAEETEGRGRQSTSCKTLYWVVQSSGGGGLRQRGMGPCHIGA